MYRTPLNLYDLFEGMGIYARYNGMHFNRKLCAFAVSLMYKKDEDTGRKKRITPWGKEEVDELLRENNITLENSSGVDYDYVYVCNMGVADRYQGSVQDKAHLAMYIKETIDDVDQQDGFILNRFVADCATNGIAIPWEELL